MGGVPIYTLLSSSVIDKVGFICTNHQDSQEDRKHMFLHRNSRRLDFFIPDKRWGIEITRDRDNLGEHLEKLYPPGRYGRWIAKGKMTDHVILSFQETSYSRLQPFPRIESVYQVIFTGEYNYVEVVDWEGTEILPRIKLLDDMIDLPYTEFLEDIIRV